MCVLVVEGSIDLKQFWPEGDSDADTAHVLVDAAKSFRIEGTLTRAFDFAWVQTAKDTKTGRRVPKYVIVSQTKPDAHIKVRLQGIDAPELHYRVDPKKENVRQHWGKRAALELASFLRGRNGGKTVIPCRVVTRVDNPSDVFDMYGRFVGDIEVKDNGGWLDINQWLVEKGWAFPTHYNSMQIDEIEAINAAWKLANDGAGAGITRSITPRASDSMYGLPAGRPGDNPQEAQADKGELCLPKMFRRLTAFREDANGAGTLEQFLAAKKGDLVIDLRLFRTLSVMARKNPEKYRVPMTPLHKLVTDGNRLDGEPTALVFVEAEAALKNSSGKVTSWHERGKPVAFIPAGRRRTLSAPRGVVKKRSKKTLARR
jgi:endonuclease YncB( thermonuclease family)